MRALVVAPGPNFSVADVYRGWAEGLAALGVETRLFELDTLLQWYSTAHQQDASGAWVQPYEEEQVAQLAAGHIRAECYAWWPDLVVVVSGFFMYPMLVDMMRDRGHKVVLVATEEPYETTRTLEKAKWGFDAVVLNDPANLKLYQETLDCPVFYGPHCYRPDVHKPGPGTRQSDVAFVGPPEGVAPARGTAPGTVGFGGTSGTSSRRPSNSLTRRERSARYDWAARMSMPNPPTNVSFFGRSRQTSSCASNHVAAAFISGLPVRIRSLSSSGVRTRSNSSR